QELRAMPSVVGVGAATSVPGELFGQTPVRPEGGGSSDEALVSPMAMDLDFFETMGIGLAAGRAFSREFGADTAAFVLNEAAVRKLGWAEPPAGAGQAVGRRLRFLGDTTGVYGEVIG